MNTTASPVGSHPSRSISPVVVDEHHLTDAQLLATVRAFCGTHASRP